MNLLKRSFEIKHISFVDNKVKVNYVTMYLFFFYLFYWIEVQFIKIRCFEMRAK